MPGRGELPDGAARARDDEVGRAERGAELVRERDQLVVVAPDATAEPLEVALAAQMQHGRPGLAERLDDLVVQARRALAPAEDEQHARPRGQVEDPAALRT